MGAFDDLIPQQAAGIVPPSPDAALMKPSEGFGGSILPPMPTQPSQGIVPQAPAQGDAGLFADLVPKQSSNNAPGGNDAFAQQHPIANEIGRLTGISARTLLPYAVAGGLGMAAGATDLPMAPVTAPAGGLAGVGLVGLSKAYDGIIAEPFNHYTGTRALPVVQDYTDAAGDALGLPKRETYGPWERKFSNAEDAVANVGSGYGAGSTILAGTKLGGHLVEQAIPSIIPSLVGGQVAQFGAEHGVTDPAAQLALGMAGGMLPGIGARVFTPQSERAPGVVSKQYQADPQVAQNIEKLDAHISDLDAADQAGIKLPQPLTADVAKSGKQVAIKNSLAGQDALNNRAVDNQQITNKIATDALKPEPNSPSAAPFINQYNKAQIDAAAGPVSESQAALDAANNNIETAKVPFTSNDPAVAVQGSQQALENRESNYKTDSADVSKMYDQTKVAGNVDYSDTHAALNSSLNGIASDTAYNALKKAAPELFDMQDEINKNVKVTSPEPPVKNAFLPPDNTEPQEPIVTNEGPAAKLLSLRNVASDLIERANRAGDRQTAAAGQKVLAGVTSDLEKIPSWRPANDAFRQRVAEPYLNGTQGEAGKGAMQGSEYLSSSLKTVEDAQQLKKALKYDQNPQAQKNIRDYWMDRLASSGSNRVNPSPTNIRGFIADNGAILDQFPKVKTELSNYSNQLTGATETSKALTAELKQRQSAFADTQKGVEGSIATQFANSPESTVGKIFNQKDDFIRNKQLSELNDVLNQDKTGESKRAFVTALKNHIDGSELRSGGFSMTPDQRKGIVPVDNSARNVSVTKLAEIFADKNKVAILKSVFPEKDFQALQQLNKMNVVEVSDVNAGIKGGSNTQNKTASAAEGTKEVAGELGNAVLEHASHAAGLGAAGRLASRAIGYLSKVGLGSDPAMIQKLHVDAQLDPRLARSLMTDPNSASGAKAQTIISKWAADNKKQNIVGKIGNTALGSSGKGLNIEGGVAGTMATEEERKGQK